MHVPCMANYTGPSSARVPRVPQVFECFENPSASVSQLVSQPVIQVFYNAGSVS